MSRRWTVTSRQLWVKVNRRLLKIVNGHVTDEELRNRLFDHARDRQNLAPVGEVSAINVDRPSQLLVLIARRTRLVGRETMTRPRARHLISTEERDGDATTTEHLVIVRRKTGVCLHLDL